MTVDVLIEGTPVPVKLIKFSDGGTNYKLEIEGLKLPEVFEVASVVIRTDTPVNDYLFEALMIHSALMALNNNEPFRSHLVLPYLPHGRADRVFEKGNAAPLQVFMDIFTKFFDCIHLTDPHSDFYLRYANSDSDITVRTQVDLIIEYLGKSILNMVLLAPDEGAMNKLPLIHTRRGYENCIITNAIKERDLESGRVISTTLLDPAAVKGQDVLIVDDIADGGGTFIPLAKLLKEAGANRVELYVTSGIFAKGLECFEGIIDRIHVYQIIGNYVTRDMIRTFNTTTIQEG